MGRAKFELNNPLAKLLTPKVPRGTTVVKITTSLTYVSFEANVHK